MAAEVYREVLIVGQSDGRSVVRYRPVATS
jgi:hypothetical protein